jgi:hypothetical protein
MEYIMKLSVPNLLRNLTGRDSARRSRRRAPSLRPQLETLEDRLVPYGAGFSFVEQQGFPGPQTTVVSQPTGFADQIVQAWTNLTNGTVLINGQTLDQAIKAAVQQAAQQQGTSAYNISDSFYAAAPGGIADWGHEYTGSLDTSGANPVWHMHYILPGGTIDFTTTDFTNPSFHVVWGGTMDVDLTLPSALSSQATVTPSVTVNVTNATVSSNNFFVWLGSLVGNNACQKMADQIAGTTQNLQNVVPTDTLNSLLQGEAAKGYTHLHAATGLDSNLVLTAQMPNLTINGSANDNILLETGPNNTVKVYAGGQWGTFDSGYLQSITINSGGGSSQIEIDDVPAGVSVNVNGAASSNDVVYIARFGSLTNIAGPVSLNYGNGSGKASLSVSDTYDSASRTVTITSNAVQFSKLPTISWSGGVTFLSVWGGSGTDYYKVLNTSSPLWLVPGAGENHISIGQATGWTPSKTLSGISGTVDVDGSIYGGKDYLTIDDSEDSSRNLTLTDSTVSFTGVPTIYYSGLTELDLVEAAGANTVTVNSVPQSTAVTIYNTASDKVTGPALGAVTTVGGLPPWDQWWILVHP